MELITKAIILPDVPHEGPLGLKLHNTQGEEILSDLTKTTWDDVWESRVNQWVRYCMRYEDNPGDFFNAWHYLNNHPAFWSFRHGHRGPDPLPLRERLHLRNLVTEGGINRCVGIMIVRANPANHTIEEDETLNIGTEVWIELGKKSWPVEHNPEDDSTFDYTQHDYMLDCGGPTMETAIIRAAHNVWEVYGNDRRVCDAPYDESHYVTVLDSEDFDTLMATLDDPGEVNERVRRAAQRLHDILAERAEEDDEN